MTSHKATAKATARRPVASAARAGASGVAAPASGGAAAPVASRPAAPSASGADGGGYPLIWHVERHLRASGMAATSFGRRAARDPRLVHDLRAGRQAGSALMARVLAFIAEAGRDKTGERA